MFSRKESSELRQSFWTAFGLYMQPILSADGEKINWVNYKTGEKDISFRMEAHNKSASVGILISHKDAAIQQLYFEQFLQLRKIFEEEVGEDWLWQLHQQDEWGRTISRITKSIDGYSIYKKEDWPTLISFFKIQIISLDNFWSLTKYSFDSFK